MDDEMNTEIYTILNADEEKDVNRKTYYNNHKKHKKGSRPHSPWWYLINKVESRILKKNTEIDFAVNDVKPVKIRLKHGKRPS